MPPDVFSRARLHRGEVEALLAGRGRVSLWREQPGTRLQKTGAFLQAEERMDKEGGRMDNFGDQLRFWRTLRGYSQMRLAHELGMSSRNLSFLETGRSRPTRPTVMQLVRFLNIPCRARDQLMALAGLKPEVARSADSSNLEPFYSAVKVMLSKHNPYPALVLNRWWDLVDANAVARRLLGSVSPGDNLVQQCLLNADWMRAVLNPEEVQWSVYRELHHDLMSFHDERFMQIYADVERLVAGKQEQGPDSNPAVRFCLMLEGQPRSFTSMVTRFRAPSDTRIAELKVELFFPTDAATEDYLQRLYAELVASDPAPGLELSQGSAAWALAAA